MDNLTHTLISVMAGEAIARAAPSRPDGMPADARRDMIVATMAIGGNFPDLDFLYSSFTDSKLDYLLHHRGHTHTVIGALAIAALLYAAQYAWMRWKRYTLVAAERGLLLAVAAFATLLHVAMDFTNSYGVHPFWPLDNRWFYGDSVFIIEPLLWAACAPLTFLLHSRVARFIVALVLAAGAVLSVASGLVPHSMVVFYAAVVGALLLIARRARPQVALACGIAFWLGVTITFAGAGRVANARADALAMRLFPQDALEDSILTPMPANPLCWELILVQSARDQLILRRGMLALARRLTPPDHCRSRGLELPASAQLEPLANAPASDVQWYGEYRTSSAHLAELVAADCRASALMRFARAPWVAAIDGGLVIGDLRYDREPELGFAEIDLGANPGSCPAYTPPWRPPREDLLQRSEQRTADSGQ